MLLCPLLTRSPAHFCAHSTSIHHLSAPSYIERETILSDVKIGQGEELGEINSRLYLLYAEPRGESLVRAKPPPPPLRHLRLPRLFYQHAEDGSLEQPKNVV